MILFEKIYNLGSLEILCKKIDESFNKSKIVLIQGTLAAGKTTLVKEFVKYLDLDDVVSSPTFSIMNEYSEKVRHYDIYQKGIQGFLESGLLETLMDEDKYYFIEWADSEFEELLRKLGFDYLKVEIDIKEKKRLYKVSK